MLLIVKIGVQDGTQDKESLTSTGNPELGMTRPFGILQVSSFNRTLALQLTPPMVITICMHALTVFRLLCCGRDRDKRAT